MQNYYLLLLSFLLFGNDANAQNWNTSPSQTKNFFTANKQLKFTQIVSNAANAPGDTNYYFYNTVRDSLIWGVPLSGQQCLDTLAASWMGLYKNRKEANGHELYFNGKGDSIFINTYASFGDSWNMMADANGNSILATITNVDTLTIDGNLDSIKEISLQCFNGTTPISAYYNLYQFVFSKNKGWLAITDLYNFAIVPGVPISSLEVYNSNDLFNRMPASLSNTMRYSVDLNQKFMPNNEWIYYLETNFNGSQYYWIHDSIHTVLSAGNATFNCEIRRRTFLIYSNPPFGPPITTFTDTVLNLVADSFYTCLPGAPIPFREQSYSGILEIEKKQIPNVSRLFSTDTVMYGAAQINSEFHQHISLVPNNNCYVLPPFYSGNPYNLNETFNAKIGRTKCKFYYSGSGFSVVPPYYFNLLYANINGDIYSNKINVSTLSINQLNNIECSISPNPAHDILNMHFTNADDIASIQILNMNGACIQTISAQQNNAIDISALPSGVYQLRMLGQNVVAHRKFIKY
jgi:hypothetical protein